MWLLAQSRAWLPLGQVPAVAAQGVVVEMEGVDFPCPLVEERIRSAEHCMTLPMIRAVCTAAVQWSYTGATTTLQRASPTSAVRKSAGTLDAQNNSPNGSHPVEGGRN